jgi:hypothetical protein
MACSRLALQTQDLRVLGPGFPENWGDAGGTRDGGTEAVMPKRAHNFQRRLIKGFIIHHNDHHELPHPLLNTLAS